MKHLISIDDVSQEEMSLLFAEAKKFKEGGETPNLCGKLLANCFFEASTRTRLSFEVAMKKLGGGVIGFADTKGTSNEKGESLEDSVQVISSYADLIVLRHPEKGAAHRAARVSSVPVINAGDGSGEHPTQTLLDLFTIQEAFGSLEGKSLIMAGDLKYGRTAHSLARALSHFNTRLFFVAQAGFDMPGELLNELRAKGTLFSFHRTLEEVIDRADVIYMTRMQKERFTKEESADPFLITNALLAMGRPHLKVLHPLPRNDEIAKEVDATDHALYFEQAKNGLFVRAALLAKLLPQVVHV